MKQLLLYFLFFVCAAFILIQCARFFPSDSQAPKSHPTGGKIINRTPSKNTNSPSSASQSGLHIISPEKKPVFNLYFTEQAFPMTMMNYISRYQFLSYQYWRINENKMGGWQLFYNPYTHFTYTGLFAKNDSIFVANNPVDGEK